MHVDARRMCTWPCHQHIHTHMDQYDICLCFVRLFSIEFEHVNKETVRLWGKIISVFMQPSSIKRLPSILAIILSTITWYHEDAFMSGMFWTQHSFATPWLCIRHFLILSWFSISFQFLRLYFDLLGHNWQLQYSCILLITN